jgi:hypothetical protein
MLERCHRSSSTVSLGALLQHGGHTYSYTFLVHVQGSESPNKRSAKRFIKKMTSIVSTAKTRHEIGQDIKGINERVKEVAERWDRSGNTSDFAFELHPKFPLIIHFILFFYSL